MAINENEYKIDPFIKGLTNAITEQCEQIYEEYKKDLIADLDRRRDQLIAGIVLNWSKHMEVNTFGQRLVIEIQAPNPSKDE